MMDENNDSTLEPVPPTNSINDKKPDQGMIDAHRLLVMWLFIATFLLSIGLLIAMLYVNSINAESPIMVVVLIAGALGGFVSSLRRLYSFQDIYPRQQYSQLFRKTSFYVLAYSFTPGLVGMIGAAWLYVVFAAGLLESPLFPRFHCSSNVDCTTFAGFVKAWGPSGSVEYAKAIVWGFVAGFSERFVPNILNRLSNDVISKK